MADRSASYVLMMEQKPGVILSAKQNASMRQRSKWLIALVVFLGMLAVTLVILQFCIKGSSSITTKDSNAISPYTGDCTITLVESIPEGVKFPAGSVHNPSIYNGWMNLLKSAEEQIDIASFYWTLQGSDTNTSDPSTQEGENVFEEIQAAAKRGVKIRIVQSPRTDTFPSLDTVYLSQKGLADVRCLNITRLVGSGILHTKMWLVDRKHFYVGSANQDWRALTQVQELGLMSYNCSCLANDMSKIFEVYWDLAKPNSQIPDPWPDKYKTGINADSPAQIKINGSNSASIYLTSSPPKLSPPGRQDDLAAILRVINSATKFVYISVMDYFPTTLYTDQRTYWPVIDDALRKAAFDRKVHVRLLASLWNHTRSDMKYYLRSLAALNRANYASVEVRLYTVSPYTKEIVFTRVNHNKFMVTESVAYVGTSNWSADYFLYTGGIAYVINETETGDTVRAQLQAVFERNWYSNFTTPVYCQY
ncbi:phospholipase D3-like [Orbicella faveolata]|uniref:phospholipase D3-like n=1 Tax=Orbicella faveolata TaxID=48498 RepID=UPI0009E469CB|nr:phospholipase D3-like [Orbicella faveolata]